MHTRIERDHVRFTINGIPLGTDMRPLKQMIENQRLVLYCVQKYDVLADSLNLEITHEWVDMERIHESIKVIQKIVEDYLEGKCMPG